MKRMFGLSLLALTTLGALGCSSAADEGAQASGPASESAGASTTSGATGGSSGTAGSGGGVSGGGVSGSPAATGTATSRAGGGTAASIGISDGSGLESVAAARDSAVVRVVYDIEEPTGSSRLTWSQDPPKLRIEDRLSLTVSDGTSARTCSGADRSQCTEVPVATAELAGTSGRGVIEFGLGLLDARDSLPSGLLQEAGERVIAGRQAECSVLDPAVVGEVTGDTGDGPAEFCTDVETGWPLSATGAGLSLVAIEFGTPAAGDFELP